MGHVISESPRVTTLAAKRHERLRIVDAGVWLAFCCVVIFTVLHHEPWADEAQAWLLARDLPLGQLLTSELRYEGSPGLWHIMLWALMRLHLPYTAMSWMSAAIAMLGAAYLIFKAPFPRPMRYAIAASYWILYQYAAIARQYVLIPPLAFVAADLYARAQDKTYKFTAVLVVLAFTSVHGALIAIAFASAHAVQISRRWHRLDRVARRRQTSAAAIFCVSLLLILLQVLPPKDVFKPPSRHGIDQVLFALNGALLDWLPASIVLALLVGAWAWKRNSIVLFVVGVGGLIGLYGLVHGWPHHLGLTFVMIVAVLWVSWPSQEESARFSRGERIQYLATLAGVSAMLTLHIFYSAMAIYHEYRMPYSGGRDAAMYLRGIIGKKQKVYGFDYGMTTVLAYFDRNILENHKGLNGGAAFFHHSADFPAADEQSFMKFRETRPEYLLFICWYAPQGPQNRALATENGYVRERAFPGRVISKASYDVYQTYVLYRRADIPSGVHGTTGQESQTHEPCTW